MTVQSDLLLHLCNTAITDCISNNEQKANEVCKITINIFERYLHSTGVQLSTPVEPKEVLKICSFAVKHN
jgi:hypothetical protein